MDHCEVKKRKRNPREDANLFSLLTFAYTRSLFRRAYKHNLEEDDLYEVISSCSSKKLGDELEKRYNKEKSKKSPKSVYRILWDMFGLKYFLIGCTDMTFRITRSFLEPDAFANLIFYFSEGQTKFTKNDAYYYATIILVFSFMTTLYYFNNDVYISTIGIQMRTAFSAFLYRKTLKLSPAALSEISFGNIVTLITKDVQIFQSGIWTLNDLWIGCLHNIVVCYLIYSRIGVTTFAGIFIFFGIIPIQMYVGKVMKRLKMETNKNTDERLQVTQEALSVIKTIKMYTWEDYFIGKINSARKLEINKMLAGFYLKILVTVMGILVSRLGFYILVMAYVLMDNQPEATVIFFLMSNYSEIRYFFGYLIPDGIGKTAEFLAAMTRLNKVLEAEESPMPQLKKMITKPIIKIEKVTVAMGQKDILKNVTLTIEPGLTVVTGQVGSGKSSLLKVILENYPLNTGKVATEGSISYASQDPWLFPSSIKQNILFGEEFSEKRYSEVVRICALEYDFNLLEHGDETILIDKGLNLSKGQQARVNLARSVYKKSDIYLLDDCLTSLDGHVQDYIFKECIKQFLKGKICVFVSQSERHIKSADSLVIMKDGQISKMSKPTAESMDEIKASLKEGFKDEKVIEKEEVVNENEETGKLLETEQTKERKRVYKETLQQGSVNIKNYKKYCTFGGGTTMIVIYLLVCGIRQFADSYSDKLLTKWVDQQQLVLNLKANITKYEANYTLSSNTFKNQSILNTNSSRCFEIPESTDKYDTNKHTYLKTDKEKLNTSCEVNDTFSSDMLKNLTERLQIAKTTEKHTFKWYYILLLAGVFIDTVKTGIMFDFCRRASINIHISLIKNMLHAVMGFFDNHFIGNILNRLSQDLVNMDENLGYLLNGSFGILYYVCGAIILIVSVNYLFIFYTAFVILCMVLFGQIYLPFARSTKRLEASTRSPIIGHLNSTLEGLTTIRAYKAEKILMDEFDRHHDLYTSCYYTVNVFQTAYGFFGSCLTTTLSTCVILTFIFANTGSSAGSVGLALTQVMFLGHTINWAVRQYADLESMMTSVERVLEYEGVKTENQSGSLLTSWPKEGNIDFENVSLIYNDHAEIILKQISFNVNSQQKIGIIGRTGAGKSSIISTIFRLYDVEGKISIDGADIKTLPLKSLRKNIAIIPQDPVLFSGTIRSNLDPFNNLQDEYIWKALEKSNLKSFITNLDQEVSATSSSLSLGQKQMLCVARAILSNAKIVILDEATANMDEETETLIYQTIKDNFSKCTVLMIAHRLQSILECDRVVVMDRGEVKEFSDPKDLLKNKDGYLYQMVHRSSSL